MKKVLRLLMGTVLTSGILLVATVMAAVTPAEIASGERSSVATTIGLGAAAAFAVSVSILGAGYAVGRIGSAAVGALAEKPELLPKTILFVALAEGLAVLGFAIAMILLQKI